MMGFLSSREKEAILHISGYKSYVSLTQTQTLQTPVMW